MRKLLTAALAVAATTAAPTAAVIPISMQGGDINVTVSYKGKGPVDDKHNIVVFLFDHPDPTEGSQPLGMQSIDKNGGTATFRGITTDPVYVKLVYDEKSGYRGGPPPAGAPVGSYQKGGKPVPVKPGAKVTVSFDDSVRWK